MNLPSIESGIEPPDVIILSTQRSGTHFVLSLLGHHPGVQTRGEFILHYQRQREAGIAQPECIPDDKVPFRYRRRHGYLNIGIVMYSHLDLFEKLCGPISRYQVIHLVRNPLDVARSTFQMAVDRSVLGSRFQAHYHSADKLELPPLAFSPDEAISAAQIAELQNAYRQRLADHPAILELTYEEICGNAQVNLLSKKMTSKILQFLQLKMHGLRTGLVKTSQRGTGSNQLAVASETAL